MSVSTHIQSRWSNGFVVHSNPDCAPSARRFGHLSAVAKGDAPVVEVVNAKSGGDRADENDLGLSLHPDFVKALRRAFPDLKSETNTEKAARNFCYWLEDQYPDYRISTPFDRLVRISVPDMPNQEVVDSTMSMLRSKGWIVSDSRSGSGDNGYVTMGLPTG